MRRAGVLFALMHFFHRFGDNGLPALFPFRPIQLGVIQTFVGRNTKCVALCQFLGERDNVIVCEQGEKQT